MGLLSGCLQAVIEGIYSVVGDYGIAIAAVTILIRTLMLPLNIRQRGQMKKQRSISTKVEELKKKYRNDSQKMNQELQKLYEKEGIGGTGCLLSLIQFPVMMCLYNGIRVTAAAGTATVLLPWVSSLLMRDRTMILPVMTLVVQLLPQMYPYIRYFSGLNLQKTPVPVILGLVLANSMFAFMIPSGVGLYYFVSGVYSAVEQLAVCVREMQVQQC